MESTGHLTELGVTTVTSEVPRLTGEAGEMCVVWVWGWRGTDLLV